MTPHQTLVMLAKALKEGDESARQPLYDLWLEMGLRQDHVTTHLRKRKWHGCNIGPAQCALLDNVLRYSEDELRSLYS